MARSQPESVEKRTIGPVTLATGGAAAATGLLGWVLSLVGIHVPVEVQGYITVLLVLAAGYAVRPGRKAPDGRHEA